MGENAAQTGKQLKDVTFFFAFYTQTSKRTETHSLKKKQQKTEANEAKTINLHLAFLHRVSLVGSRKSDAELGTGSSRTRKMLITEVNRFQETTYIHVQVKHMCASTAKQNKTMMRKEKKKKQQQKNYFLALDYLFFLCFLQDTNVNFAPPAPSLLSPRRRRQQQQKFVRIRTL